MPIHKDFHPAYKANIGMWTKCEDTFQGQDAVHAAGTKYLPKLKGQTSSEYKSYRDRALFYSITAKSISGMVGMATSKAPSLQYPEAMSYYFKDNSGLQFYELYIGTLTQIILKGRIGVFVDVGADGDRYAQTYMYEAESIVNWTTNSDGKLTSVVLRECQIQTASNDQFKVEEVEYFRYLFLDSDGIYSCEIYDDKGKILVTKKQPTISGSTIDYIPFYIAGPSGLRVSPEKSPTIDIVNVNLSHYLSSADLEHGRHFTGLPTPVVIGADGEKTLSIGSSTAWGLPVGGDAKYLEFTGQGLKTLENALDQKQSQLASLSARILDNSGKGSESADVVKLRYMSETATLSSIIRSVESLLNTVYNQVSKYVSDETVTISLDKEFISSELSPAEIKSLSESYLNGTMSKESYIYNMRRGGRLSPNVTDQEEMDGLTLVNDIESVGQ